jgi:DNA-binding beta-propeller fold protein YncE
VLPQLRELEHRFPREIAVVGVHSGKYTTERDPARIRDASIRLHATHPVVNDRQFRIWRSYAVNAWPTLVVVDPRGYVLGQHAGEFTADMLQTLVEQSIRSAKDAGTLVPSDVHFPADEPTIPPEQLRYPAKVALSATGRLALSDAGQDRVLVGRLDDGGHKLWVELEVGGVRGYRDGAGAVARFDSPQGLAFVGTELVVCDAGNHAVRGIDLSSGAVRTIAGTGNQLRTATDVRAGALSSPWDVCAVEDRLFIAMAGTHQIWSVQRDGAGLRPHSGNRHEALVDGPHLDAALAQPMGIVSDGRQLYFVDAESSAIRCANVDPAGRVETIVGTGLFDFGNRDGVGDHVLMQHQQGIALAEDGRLLVTDSYNDALKWVDPASKSATTWVRGFNEPSGVAVTQKLAYVADTNAHRIATVDRATGMIGTLEIVMP